MGALEVRGRAENQAMSKSNDLSGPEPSYGNPERRAGGDRRDIAPAEATNLERRRGPGRRLTDFIRSAEEGEMSREQYLWLMAIDAFKRVNGKAFPSWTDVLEVARKLGYRKTMPSEINLGARCEDWTERPDAGSGVNKAAPSDE